MLQVTLPGGLSRSGRIERQARFRTLTGRIEQTLIESDDSMGKSGYVTRVLGATLDKIGDHPVDAEQVEALCVADRQYLMLRLAAMLDGEQMWLKLRCGNCHALFDVETRRCDLPVKQAGAGYPNSTIQLDGKAVRVRVPTGKDQDQIENLDDAEAMRLLLQLCIESVDGDAADNAFIDALGDSEIDAIDEALDELSPAVCNQLLVICPECKKDQQTQLDHYRISGINNHYFHDEIHTLASHYHWSEAEILGLPQSRRRLYIGMINRSVGSHGQD